MPTITLSDICEVEVDDNGRCLGDWLVGTFGGVLKVKCDGRDSALHLARTAYPTSRENAHILAATARTVSALRGLASGTGGVVLPTRVADLRMAGSLILIHIPAMGRPGMVKATPTRSGIKLAPPVPAVMRALAREPWRSLLASHGGGGAVLLDAGGGAFWAALPDLVTYPWLPISLADAVKEGQTTQWGALEHLGLARHLLCGLNMLHAAGMVHGDIRPCNILANGDSRIPCSYGFAEYGRFPSAMPLDPSATYLLSGTWDARYWPTGTGETDLIEAGRLKSEFSGDCLLVTIEETDEVDTTEASTLVGTDHADECCLLLVPPLAFDCLRLRRSGRHVAALCQAHYWLIEGRFLAPAGLYAEKTRNFEGGKLVRRPSVRSDLFSLAMLLVELRTSGALPPQAVAGRLLVDAAALDAALLCCDSEVVLPILRRASLSMCEACEWPWLTLWLRLVLFCLRAGRGIEDASRINAVIAQSHAEQRALGLSAR